MKHVYLFAFLFIASCSYLSPKRELASVPSLTCFELLDDITVEGSLERDLRLMDKLSEVDKKTLRKDILIDESGKFHVLAKEVSYLDLGVVEKGSFFGGFQEKEGFKFVYYQDSYKERILRPLGLDEAFKNFKEEFFEIYRIGTHVILPRKDKKKNFFEAWKIVDISQEKIKLENPKGKTFFTSSKKVFEHNFPLRNKEREIVEAFYSGGGRGAVFRYNPENISDIYYEGIFISVKSMPTFGNIDALVDDKRAYDKINNILKNRSIILTTDERRMYGSFSSGNSDFALEFQKGGRSFKSDGYLILNNRSDVSIIEHEMLHYEDSLEGLNAKALGKLAPLLVDEVITQSDYHLIRAFIHEQRAYATQFKFIDEMEFEGTLKNYVSSSYEMALQDNLFYMKKKQDDYDTFRAHYLGPLKGRLKQLELWQRKVIIDIINSRCIDYPDMGCDKLLAPLLKE